MTLERPKGPVVLCILDGFGDAPAGDANAITLAKTPNLDRIREKNEALGPRAMVETSGLAVGLPEGQMGNSEVGHMNIGAGRVVMQDLPMIDEAIASGSFAENPTLRKLIDDLKTSGGACHLMGLLSPGGVHSHQDHIVATARILHEEGIPVQLHAFLDGRDTPPTSGLGYLKDVLEALGETAEIVTLTGRYYAMDRDKNWDRVERAWRAMVLCEGEKVVDDWPSALERSYADGKEDEFVLPHVRESYEGMRDGDAIFMANFRADRAREILTALVDPAFDGFSRDRVPALVLRVGLTEYSDALNPFMTTMFPAPDIKNTIGECVAKAGLRQLRIAETEKYAHVTFFLNGGREDVFEGEERQLIPSPKVATYDLQPEMSAPEVTDNLVKAIREKAFDLIVVNFANPDMVGHTGVLPAAIKAVETIDASLGRLEEALAEVGGVMLVTADHGNIERMRDPETGAPHTAHTVGAVPLLLVNGEALSEPTRLASGKLADLAPTVLSLLHLEQPEEMTGHSLLKPAESLSQTAQGARAETSLS